MPAVPFSRFRSEVEELYLSESAPSTARKMLQTLREFAEVEGLSRTSDMDGLSIVRWKKLHPARGSWTARSLLISYRRACNLAIAKGYLRRSPFALRGLNDWANLGDPAPTRHHSLESIGKVLAHLKALACESWSDHRLHALAATVAWTGVRRDEAIHALVGDFDLAGGVLIIVLDPGI